MTTNGRTKRGNAKESSPEIKKAKSMSAVGKRSSVGLHSRPLTKNKHLLKWVEKIAAERNRQRFIGLMVPRGSMTTFAWTWSSAEPL